jgi:hypothetical protein
VSADSVVPGAGKPQALNRFAYGLNNPVKFVDPSGHDPENSWIERHNNARGLFWEPDTRRWVPGEPKFWDADIFAETMLAWVDGQSNALGGHFTNDLFAAWRKDAAKNKYISYILAAFMAVAEGGGGQTCLTSPSSDGCSNAYRATMFALRNRYDCNLAGKQCGHNTWAGGSTLLADLITPSQFDGLNRWDRNMLNFKLDPRLEKQLEAALVVSWEIFEERKEDFTGGADAFHSIQYRSLPFNKFTPFNPTLDCPSSQCQPMYGHWFFRYHGGDLR